MMAERAAGRAEEVAEAEEAKSEAQAAAARAGADVHTASVQRAQEDAGLDIVHHASAEEARAGAAGVAATAGSHDHHPIRKHLSVEHQRQKQEEAALADLLAFDCFEPHLLRRYTELTKLDTASQLQEKLRLTTLNALRAERRLLTRLLAYVAPGDPAGKVTDGGVSAGDMSREMEEAMLELVDSFLDGGHPTADDAPAERDNLN
jgi:hypothetical protein